MYGKRSKYGRSSFVPPYCFPTTSSVATKRNARNPFQNNPTKATHRDAAPSLYAVMQRDVLVRRERTNFVETQIDEIIDAAANVQTVTVEVVHYKTLRSENLASCRSPKSAVSACAVATSANPAPRMNTRGTRCFKRHPPPSFPPFSGLRSTQSRYDDGMVIYGG